MVSFPFEQIKRRVQASQPFGRRVDIVARRRQVDISPMCSRFSRLLLPLVLIVAARSRGIWLRHGEQLPACHHSAAHARYIVTHACVTYCSRWRRQSGDRYCSTPNNPLIAIGGRGLQIYNSNLLLPLDGQRAEESKGIEEIMSMRLESSMHVRPEPSELVIIVIQIIRS